MKIVKTTLVLLCFILFNQLSFSQDDTPSYKEMVVDNPTAEADMKVVGDYVNALINNKMSVAESLLHEKYMSYGPAANDSVAKQESMKNWMEAHKVRTNQSIGFVSQTFKVTQGELAGHWVSQWGTYSFTQDGKDIEIPYQLTARVADGKIISSTTYFDNMAVVEKLGYTITPPKED
ncbi:nuclear transport factor 2-like protein [Winogradskyella alexanderae]|uniref:Nuclear transport factor 2 family protein n=1 Tax=Winogradskyella alexanderae TaxID=2877123 RepID=A0ABS7XVC5_9FLAO|nr:hypothetical protein [Winogradskyella alexanderae]MCA0133439.1 hypothetical protein [Winogradskyella alexanderae]